MLDRGLWISWYPAQRTRSLLLMAARELHTAHAEAAALSLGGTLQVREDRSAAAHPAYERSAAPKGADYILIFGAESAHAFSKGSTRYERRTSKLDANLTDEDRHMLACASASACHHGGGRSYRRAGGRNTQGTDLELRDSTPEFQRPATGGRGRTAVVVCGLAHGGHGQAARMLVFLTSGWAKHLLVLYEFTSLADPRAKHLPSMRELYPAQMKWTEEWIPKLTHTPGIAGRGGKNPAREPPIVPVNGAPQRRAVAANPPFRAPVSTLVCPFRG